MTKFTNSKNYFSKKSGITLTELLVASALIGVVMLGVAAFSVTITQMQSSTNKAAVLELKVKAAMSKIVNDAYEATGDETNRGIRGYEPPGFIRSICFRRDTLQTPDNYVDDSWSCYFKNSQQILWRCQEPTNPVNVPPDTLFKCAPFVASLEPILELGVNDFFQIVEDPLEDNRLVHVIITLTSQHKITDPIDPINNPNYTLSTTVSPLAHSR